MNDVRSEKSFTVAVVLAGVFGLLGIHHFYVGRIGHGVFDLAMTVVGVYLIWTGAASESGAKIGFGLLVLALDYVHTVYFIYRLIVGTYRDGTGRYIKLE